MKWLLTIAVILVFALHQDNWLWHDRSLVFGFLPVGLAYQVGYSVVAALLMAALVKFAWPSELEHLEADKQDGPSEAAHT